MLRGNDKSRRPENTSTHLKKEFDDNINFSKKKKYEKLSSKSKLSIDINFVLILIFKIFFSTLDRRVEDLANIYDEAYFTKIANG